jgi:hypothetical protein
MVWFSLGGSVWIVIAGILMKIQVMFFRLTLIIIFRRTWRTKMKKKIEKNGKKWKKMEKNGKKWKNVQ